MEEKKKTRISKKRSEQETQRKKRSDLDCSQCGFQLHISFHLHMTHVLVSKRMKAVPMNTSEDCWAHNHDATPQL